MMHRILSLGFWLILSSPFIARGAEWQLIQVPGAWESHGPEAARNYDGFAWYRTWVKPHDSFFSQHERNLFEESVSINIRALADAHEVFVNGKRIGGGGRFPPDYASGQNELHRHKVPAGALHKGVWNEIAIRVYNRSGPGGFLGEAPFIMNYFMECVLAGAWEFRLGGEFDWAAAVLTEKPARSAFDQFHESNRVLGEAAQLFPGPRLSPAESLDKMKTAEGFAVDDLVHEPVVAQPVHLSFDERGRMWVAQYRQYPYPAGLRMISRDKYYRAHYDKVPPAPPNHDRGRDVISIHEDSDGDGEFDKHKVFVDGLNLANAAVRGRGGVWVMHTPYLLFYPDANFDDAPDGPPVVHLQGFGLEDTHSVANGLVWGMDGWLYGAQGSTTSSRVTRPGIDPPGSAGVYFEGCMVWRYHPETKEYEIFAEGSGNTFGLEIDAQGRLFSGHNGGTTRGWHYVQGGYFMKQAFDPGKFGPPRNPYAFGQLPMIKSENSIQRFSHLAAVAEGTAIPRKYWGTFFSVDPLHSVVIASERKAMGATFQTVDLGPLLSCADEAFRPVFIANAPDGSIYVADFYEYYIAHGQHYQSNIDPTTGRIYRLRGVDLPLERDTRLDRKSSRELVALLAHENKWHRHTAVRLLGERRDAGIVPELKRLLSQSDGLPALAALWSLHQQQALDRDIAMAGLRHSYAPVRSWTVRLLGDRRELPETLVPIVVEQARREADAEARSQMAATARRLPVGQGLPIAAALLEHSADVNDVYIPLLIWWVFEANSAEHRQSILSLFKSRELWDRPLAFEHILPRIMRRYALEGRRQDLLTCAELLRLAPSQRHAGQLMKGFEEAYRGRSITGLPDELIAAMEGAGQSLLIVRVRRGEADAIHQALEIVRDGKAKIEDRLLYARAFGEVRDEQARTTLLGLVGSEAPGVLQRAALASLGGYADDQLGQAVADLLPKLAKEIQAAGVALLASRPNWTVRLLESIQRGVVRPENVPADAVERMRSHDEKLANEQLAKFFPAEAGSKSLALRDEIARIEGILRGGQGNPYAGEPVFMERCASCHKLFFKGGQVGPDLTNYQRDHLGTMLTSIVDPNAEIREGYQYYAIEMTDDRSLTGFLVDRDPQVVVLRGLDGEDITLRQAEIREMRPMGRSLMPEGLLEALSDQQLRDLFAYLRISQPITR